MGNPLGSAWCSRTPVSCADLCGGEDYRGAGSNYGLVSSPSPTLLLTSTRPSVSTATALMGSSSPIEKAKATNPVKPITTLRGIGNTSSEQTERISDKNDSAMETLCCKEILYNGLGRVDAVVHSQGNGVQQVSISVQREVRNESKGNDDGHVSKNGANGDARKVPSRNARRKKSKRLWHHIHGSKKQRKETLPWNGTTSKKKGQKWGRENTLNKWNDDTFNWLSTAESSNAKEAELVEVSNEKYDVEEVEAYKEPIANQMKPVNECSGNSVAKEFEAVKQLIDFESFLPLTRFPEVPSRNARRKKSKRLWHHIHGSKKQRKFIEIQIPESDNEKKTSEHANADQNADVDKEIVPVIVHPGHIRFESSDTCSVQADEPVETLPWNGTTSKKKGQKWGRENTLNKWNDDTFNWLSTAESSNAKEAELVEVSNEKYDVEEVEAYKEPIANQMKPVNECSGNSVAKEFEAVKQLIDFESFLPLTRFPEEGDVLVYRMVELSSSWCPELSPFRVGRVSSHDCSSSKVIILPLPEYPLMSGEMLEEGQKSSSLYKDDGTLEIDFASLVDVRLFKAHESRETTPNIVPIEEMQNAAPVNNQELASCSSSRIETSSNYTA